MRKQQAGFTLIELVMVIVILGILAATALPKFYDLSSEAQVAAVKGVAGGIASGAAVNYGAYKGTAGNKGVDITGADNAAVCTVGNVASVVNGGVPAGYLIGAGTTPLANGVAYCKLCLNEDGDATCDDATTTVDNIAFPLTS